MNNHYDEIKRVYRSKKVAKAIYDRLSRWYDLIGIVENRYKAMALEIASIAEEERVLEVGCGTGWALERIARQVGAKGRVYGLDFSSGMLVQSQERLGHAGLTSQVELVAADAVRMPLADNSFDLVFSSFTLELFDTPEIPRVLAEVKRVLRPGGRFVDVSISREWCGILCRLYEWIRDRIPQIADCRPIYVARSVAEAGFAVRRTRRIGLVGLGGEIVCGVKEEPDSALS